MRTSRPDRTADRLHPGSIYTDVQFIKIIGQREEDDETRGRDKERSDFNPENTQVTTKSVIPFIIYLYKATYPSHDILLRDILLYLKGHGQPARDFYV